MEWKQYLKPAEAQELANAEAMALAVSHTRHKLRKRCWGRGLKAQRLSGSSQHNPVASSPSGDGEVRKPTLPEAASAPYNASDPSGFSQ